MTHPLRPALLTRGGLAFVLACVFVSVFAAFTPTSASAAAPDDPEQSAIRWSVTPANESGPDGRTVVEQTLDPGESVDDFLAVRNVSEELVVFRLTAADGFYTRTGRFDILPSDQESVDAGTWITLPESVEVPAGQTVVVPFELTVPDRAEPGDHAAGITASVLSVQSAEDGTSVGVESRVGFRVLTRVTGELTPAAAVQSLKGDYTTSWNPFRPGEVTVSFDVVNEGNTRLLAGGVVEVSGRRVTFPAADGIRQELLPGDVRTLTATVEGVWPVFAAPTSVVLAPTVIIRDGTGSSLAPVEARVLIWAVPWPQLLIIAGIALLVIAVYGNRRRSRSRLDAMLADAREEGRRSADARADISADAS